MSTSRNPVPVGRRPLYAAILGGIVSISAQPLLAATISAANPCATRRGVVVASACNPCAIKKSPCNPCNPCNPCAVKKSN